MRTYIALFEYEAGRGDFSVVFPDLPGCFSTGVDFTDAVKMAHEALSLYTEGETNLPEPRTLEEIQA